MTTYLHTTILYNIGYRMNSADSLHTDQSPTGQVATTSDNNNTTTSISNHHYAPVSGGGSTVAGDKAISGYNPVRQLENAQEVRTV